MREPRPTDPLRRVAAVWDWLPVFRVVAEVEHLPTAAERLGLTVSAVSRTVRVLEEQLGRELFDRVGRNLRLNAEGHAMLAGTREAMRRVHEALLDVADERLHGPLRLSAAVHHAVIRLVPALKTLLQEHPALRPEVLYVQPQQLWRALVEGRIDLALTTELVPTEDMRLVHVGTEAHGVYCGRSHPLWGRDTVDLGELTSHPFCGPPPDPGGVVRDGWPSEVQRSVVVHVAQMAVGVGVIESGGLLGVLPDAWAARSPGTLWRLPVQVVPSKELWAMLRPVVHASGAAERLLELLVDPA